MKLMKRAIFFLTFFLFLTACGEKSPPLLAQAGESGNSSATKGSPLAPVTIIVYSDFQCPACAKAEEIVKEMLNKYPDKIYLIYRYYPLPTHRHGFTSAVAAECARRQNKFWPYHDLLFDRQYDWGQNTLTINPLDSSNQFFKYAQEVGLNLDEFRDCLGSEPAKQAVLASKIEGDGLDIASTPTFFIGSRRIVGPLSLKATYEAAIQEALKKQRK